MKKDKILYWTFLVSFLMHIFLFGIIEFYYRVLLKSNWVKKQHEKERIFEVLPYIPKNLSEVLPPKRDVRFLGPKDLGVKKENNVAKDRNTYGDFPQQIPALPQKQLEVKQKDSVSAKNMEQEAKPINIPEKKHDDSFKIPIQDSKENKIDRVENRQEVDSRTKEVPAINKLIPKSHDILAKLPKEESINLNSGSVKSGKELIVNTKEFKYWSYLQKMKQKIEMVWEYPEYAKQRGIGGQLKINFSIDKDGKIEKMMLVDSSGLKVLDDAAMKALKDASPFPPFPDTWDISRLNIEGTFIYHITVIK